MNIVLLHTKSAALIKTTTIKLINKWVYTIFLFWVGGNCQPCFSKDWEAMCIHSINASKASF